MNRQKPVQRNTIYQDRFTPIILAIIYNTRTDFEFSLMLNFLIRLFSIKQMLFSPI